MRLMGKCFGHLYTNGLIIYLDDILVYSRSISEMVDRLETVFSILLTYGLKVKPAKCHFFKKKVVFLGHTVSAEHIATDIGKLQAVMKFEKPDTEKKVCKF